MGDHFIHGDADNDYFDGDHAKYDGDDVEVNAIF